jgi:hypothetical protein
MSEHREDELVLRRPRPAAGFRSELRRRLLAERPGPHRPADLWRRVALASAGGLALLALAAVLA